jgi:hypothetical protein
VAVDEHAAEREQLAGGPVISSEIAVGVPSWSAGCWTLGRGSIAPGSAGCLDASLVSVNARSSSCW